MSYRPTIGLEVHAELDTKTKMFCSSLNDPDETEPNTNICPVCLAHPGTLPTVNEEAVRHVARVGTAIGGTIADYTEFDRKSYFYPDIPKGYQISQFAFPLVSGGTLAGVPITRVHLEEDTARSTHHESKSLVDFNRAGVPLMELVTEPAIHDAETAGSFARELQLLLRTLGASKANLEKGEMRIEANISVSTSSEFGTKVEVKNLNSFKSVERAIAFEVDRQIALIEGGGAVVQETRGWDEDRQVTFAQRKKEGSADYRYFPEPDLPKIVLTEVPWAMGTALADSLPELPSEKRERYRTLGLKEEDAYTIATSMEGSAFFDAVTGELDGNEKHAQIAANYFLTDVAGNYSTLSPIAFAEMVRMIDANELSSRGAKDLLVNLIDTGASSAGEAAERMGLLQVNDTESLRRVAIEVIKEHAQVAEEYRGGKESVLQFLVGQAMKASKGAGNPGTLRELLIEEIGK